MITPYSVAKKIREIRQGQDMTQTELAAKCNVTKSLISKIETNQASIHLEMLINIAAALNVTISELLSEEPSSSFTIIRQNERKKLITNRLGGKYGFDYYRLAGSKEARLEVFVLVIVEEALKTARFVKHEGFEFVYVLNGKLRLSFRDEENILSVGDAAFFDATKPHRLCPHASDFAELFCIFLYPKLSL